MLDQHIDPDYDDYSCRECADSDCAKNATSLSNAHYWLKAVMSTVSRHILDKKFMPIDHPTKWATDQFELEIEELCHCLGVKFEKSNLADWAELAEA